MMIKGCCFELGIKRKILFLCLSFVFCVSASYAAENLYPSSQPAGMQVPQSYEVFNSSSEFSLQGFYQPGLSYSPFNDYEQGKLSGPILYGPGGDPIGGLPVENGTIILLFAVICYCVYKIYRKRKRTVYDEEFVTENETNN